MSNYAEELSQLGVSKEEKDKLVAEVIRYVLFKNNQNGGCPIKREELTQLIAKNYRQRALPTIIIKDARDRLSSIFGYEMRELQRARPASANQGHAPQQSVIDAKSYVIMSQLPPNVYKKHVEDANAAPLSGFTFVVVSVVYLAGGKITEESLWHQLRRMGLDENVDCHSELGNIKQALEGLVQQRYLQKNKASGPEGNQLFYELAERALDGPISEKIKEYISEIVKKDVTDADAD